MASKGQKFNKYTKELKEEVIGKYFNKDSGLTTLSKEYNIPLKTLKTWMYKEKHPELQTGAKRGRPRKDEEIDYKERYEILKKYQAFLKAQRERK